MSPVEYYEGVGAHDNEHPWAWMTCEELLDRHVDDPTAKRFLKVMARSDLATESHNTNGLNALKNFVMDVEGYIGLYSIQNGNEQLIELPAVPRSMRISNSTTASSRSARPRPAATSST